MRVCDLIEKLKELDSDSIIFIPGNSYSEDGELVDDIELRVYDNEVHIHERW